MKKNIILFILMLMCASGAWAQQTFISAVKISAEEGKDTNIQRLKNDGYTVIDQDLNQDAGGRYIYIGYKTTTDASQAISGLIIMESGNGVEVRSSYYKTNPIEYQGKNYYRCDSYGSNDDNCDLNRKAGGSDITLYYTKDGNTDHGAMLLTELTAVVNNKNMAGYSYIRHWQYGTDMYSTSDTDVYGDANKGTGDDPIYFPCKYHTHSYSATFNWADDGKTCSVTTHCSCGDSSTGNATITSTIKTPATYRVDGITTYTAKITLNSKEFSGAKDVQDIVMPLAEVKTIVKGMIDSQVAAETRADMSAFGAEKKALVDAAVTRNEVLAILDAFPADLSAAVALVIAQAKSDAKAAIQAALEGVTDAGILAVGNTAITDIDNATSVAQVNAYKANALAEIQRLKELLQAKADAKAAIQAALEGATDAGILAVGNTAITDIDNATSVAQVNSYKANALAEIQRLKELLQAKADAKAAIQAALQCVTDETILAAGSTALTDIDNASTVDKVNTIKSDALAEIQRLKDLAVAKADAIAEIEALVDDTEDALAISEGNRYIALIRTANKADAVNALLARATGIINNLLSESSALAFSFTGTGMPVETQHNLEGLKMTYSDDGEDITVTVNGAEVTYPLAQVSELTYFRGTPTVALHANEDPDHAGNYYTTFYSSLEAYALPEGVKAYRAAIDGDVIRMTAIEGDVLPQGEAVLLYSDVSGDMTMEIADPASASKSDTNQFEGVDVATDQDAASHYMLSYGQNQLGFYKMNPSTMLSANKAFIVQSSSPAKAFRMVFAEDEVDGIERISDDTTNLPTGIYSVSGVRLNKLQKGINIVNGKKIVVK